MTKSTQSTVSLDEAAAAEFAQLIDERIDHVAEELVQLAGIVACIKHALNPLIEDDIDAGHVASTACSAQNAAMHIEARLCELAHSLTGRGETASRLAGQIATTNMEGAGHA